jgi:hypothetical protein
LQRLGHQHVDDRRLRAGGQVGALQLARLVFQLARLRHHRGLQAGKGKVQVAAVQQRARQREGRGVAKLGQPRQRRPAGVAQAQQLGRLVEGFAGGVVDGLAQQL